MTLASLFDRCGLQGKAFLQTDTECFDADIVQMALTLPVPPECISFENVHILPNALTTLFDRLRKHGYVWIHDEWNTLALYRTLLVHWHDMSE